MPELSRLCEFCGEVIHPEEECVTPCQCVYVYHRPCMNHVFQRLTDPESLDRCAVCQFEYKRRYRTEWGRRIQTALEGWNRNMVSVYAVWVFLVTLLAISAGGYEAWLYGLSVSHSSYVMMGWTVILSVYLFHAHGVSVLREANEENMLVCGFRCSYINYSRVKQRGLCEAMAYFVGASLVFVLNVLYHATWADWATIALAGGLMVRMRKPLFVLTADLIYMEIESVCIS